MYLFIYNYLKIIEFLLNHLLHNLIYLYKI